MDMTRSTKWCCIVRSMFRPTVVLLALFAGAFSAFAQGVPCSEANLQYYSPTPNRTHNLSISTDTRGTFDATKKVTSELGPNRWFVTVDPVYTKKPPWNTTIFIGNVGSDTPILKISILDHGNMLAVKWITDRLLLVEVWWGRFGMSDWIFDVDRHKVVYDELVDHHEEYSCTEGPQDTRR